MANLDETLDLVTQRTGSTSGTPLNEAEAAGYRAGIKLDIASIMNQMNNVYHPLFDTLSKEVGLDALDFGLAGNIIFTHVTATAADANAYWDSTTGRARTIKETVDVLLSEISALENTINFTVDVDAYDDSELRGLVANNQNNLKQLRLDTVGDLYGFDNDGVADNTYSLSQAVDAIGAFFTGFPGTGNTYTPTYPTLSLAVNLSDVILDTTVPTSTITNLDTQLTNITTFTGMDNINDTTPDYTAHGAVTVVSDGDSLELAIQKLDAQVTLASGAFATATNVTSNSPGDYTSDDFVFGSPSLDDDTITTHDSRMYFNKSKSAFRAGKVTGTDWDSANAGVGSVAFGVDNMASGLGAGCLGGSENEAAAEASAVVAGGGAALGNTVTSTSERSLIGAGQLNSITNSDDCFIGSGGNNTITGLSHRSLIAGGGGTTAGQGNNISQSAGSVIGGGVANDIDLTGGLYNVVSGGFTNQIGTGTGTISGAGIHGGQSNSFSGTVSDSTILGGNGNSLAEADRSVILGGQDNSMTTGGNHNLIGPGGGSGTGNTIINATYGTILNGSDNIVGNASNTASNCSVFSGAFNEVLSGLFCFIGGGQENVIDVGTGGTYNIVLGGGHATPANGNVINTAGIDYAVILGGHSNTVTASEGVVVAGNNNTVSGVGGITLAGDNNTASGARAAAMGKNAAAVHQNGFTQSNATLSDTHYVVWSATTTSATPEELFLDGDAGSSRYAVADDDRSGFVIYVNAAEQNTNEVAMYKFEGLIRRDGIASTTTLVFANKTILHEDNASLDFNITADTTNGALKLEATGIAAETWIWHATGIMNHIAS